MDRPVPKHTIEVLGDTTKTIPNTYLKGREALLYCSQQLKGQDELLFCSKQIGLRR